jgi:hypothetical protein
MRSRAKEAQGHGSMLGARNRLMAARRDGLSAVSGRGGSPRWGGGMIKGVEKLRPPGFYRWRRKRELAAGPHVGVGVDGQHQGDLVAATTSGRAHASLVPRLLTCGAAVGLN